MYGYYNFPTKKSLPGFKRGLVNSGLILKTTRHKNIRKSKFSKSAKSYIGTQFHNFNLVFQLI